MSTLVRRPAIGRAYLLLRKRDAEHAAAGLVRLAPDPPAVALDDPLADRQPHARAVVMLLPMQALEDVEDPVRLRGIDPDAVVADLDDPRVRHRAGPDLDRGWLVAVEFECVRDEVA